MDINKKQTLTIFPYIEEIGYSDPISSEKLNKQFQSLKESVLRSIIRSQEINTSLTTMEAAVNAQALCLGNYYNNLRYQQDDTAYITAFDNILQSNPLVNYDTAYGYVTLDPVSQYSKIPRNEGYDGKVSPNVTILINGVAQPADSAPYRSLDNSLNTLYFDTLPANSDVDFEIQLPPSLTKRFNYIQVNPFPVFGYNINDIQYQDFYGAYHSVTKTVYGTNNPMFNNKAMPTKLYVSPTDFNGTIRIKARTDSTGYFGFSNIDIGFADFNNTTQVAILPFKEFLSNKNNLMRINVSTAIIDYYFDSPNAKALLEGLTPVFEATMFVGQSINGIVTKTGDSFKLNVGSNTSIPVNKQFIMNIGDLMFLELKFTEHNMTTPVFRGAKFNYTVVV